MPLKITEVSNNEEYCLFDIKNLKQNEREHMLKNSWRDILITIYTSLYIASKNQEVEPLGLKDIVDHLLKDLGIKKELILHREKELRDKTEFENEVSTYFDFLLFYIKVWKVTCNEKFAEKGLQCSDDVYDFLCDVESMVYDYSKSITTDVGLSQFSPSLVIASAISASLEVHCYSKFKRGSIKKGFNPELIKQILLCVREWQRILATFFGLNSVNVLRKFGHFVILRQQRIYSFFIKRRKFHGTKQLTNVFKSRSEPQYSHTYFETLLDQNCKQPQDDVFVFSSLNS